MPDRSIVLETERLRLEPLQTSHATEMLELLSDQRLYRFIPREPPPDLASLASRYERLARGASSEGDEVWLNWILRSKNEGKCLGRVEATIRRDGSAYLAYEVSTASWGQGFATEACLRIIDLLFTDYGSTKIVAEVDTRNIASIRLLERLGFQRGALHVGADHFKGSRSDELTYDLSRLDYERNVSDRGGTIDAHAERGKGARLAADRTTVALTLLALSAFASNSLLTRLALGAREIDAATFTAIRLGAGAVVLTLLVRARAGAWTPLRGRGASGPLALFAYALPFSFAYLRIGAAVGALVLFGVVQLTMIGYGMLRGERPSAPTWAGVALASGGLVALTAPSAARPDPLGLVLMAIAGIAWAVYTLVGRSSPDPIAANARSFLWSVPLAIPVIFLSRSPVAASGRGIGLALVSGALTSGLGYAVWYRALPGLTVTQAAVAQLSVPVIAAAGAAALLDERLSARLVVSGAAVLIGVGLVLSARSRSRA